jgi:uncharacterized membrane protein
MRILGVRLSHPITPPAATGYASYIPETGSTKIEVDGTWVSFTAGTTTVRTHVSNVLELVTYVEPEAARAHTVEPARPGTQAKRAK